MNHVHKTLAIGSMVVAALTAALPGPARADEPVAASGLPALPGGLRVGGKFDVAYERAGHNGDLRDGQNVLRNYHHFLFLSRQGADPIGFNAELIDLSFYELTARVAPRDRPYRFLFRAGKIMVPFGPDPLYHKSYGGLSGFDQRLLPVVWAQHGASAQARLVHGRLAASNEIYAVAGHDLGEGGATLDLQKDLAPLDRARVAVGDRASVGFGPLTVWYSIYWNSMRFGRRLLLQAVDASLWHLGDWPVLSRVAAGIGAVRGDVSGGAAEGFGGPGKDYYHFADYVWLRFTVFDWLYVQARSGLQTFDNRRGLFLDDTRLDERDGSHHSLTVVAQRWGAQTSLGYTWNFEKANEHPDDFLRLLVSYEF